MVWHRRHGSAVDHGALYRASGWLVDFVRHALVTGTEPTPPSATNRKKTFRIDFASDLIMFPRLAEHYKSVVQDLVMSLQALTKSLKTAGVTATCYSCGDGLDGHGASFVAEIGEGHMVRFLVSDCGISWVESRNGRELVKLEGAEAIHELQRMADLVQMSQKSIAAPLAQTA